MDELEKELEELEKKFEVSSQIREAVSALVESLSELVTECQCSDCKVSSKAHSGTLPEERARKTVLVWLMKRTPVHFFPTREHLIRCGYKPCPVEGCEEVVLGDWKCWKHREPLEDQES